jgi:hypothetical protein
MNWQDVAKAAPTGLKLLGSALAMTGVGAPIGALVGGLGAIIGHAIGQEPTPDNVAAAFADPALQAKLMELQETNRADLQKMLITRDIAAMTEEGREQAAILADKQSARLRDTALINAGKTNVRADLMLAGAYISVVVIVIALVIGHIDAGSAIFALLLMLATKFAGNIGTAFDFEYGSSRGSIDKTAMMASQANDTATKLTAAALDAPKPAVDKIMVIK